jgi:protocatechuate 3,4-dioxygenase beta subunit
MDGDERPIGRLLSRREVLAMLAVAGGALRAERASAQPLPACVVRPEQTEGPFFVDEQLDRADIRSDPATGLVKPGVTLQIAFNVSQLAGGGCTPLRDVRVDVWHCDALGVYSDTSGWGANTLGQKFLRGYQVTDDAGVARFTTIYPGGYQGRAVHIHFKIRTPAGGPSREFTSQLYFDDALTDRIHASAPYASRGPRRVRNEADGPFRRGGRQLILPLAESGQGYAGTFNIALDRSQRTGRVRRDAYFSA